MSELSLSLKRYATWLESDAQGATLEARKRVADAMREAALLLEGPKVEDERIYTPDESRVCDYLQKITNGTLGCGDDPIGFLIASHQLMAVERKEQHAKQVYDANAIVGLVERALVHGDFDKVMQQRYGIDKGTVRAR